MLYLLFLSLFSTFQSPDCRKYHTGTYVYYDAKSVRVVRTEAYQTEFFGDTLKMLFTIRWPSACHYSLHPVSITRGYITQPLVHDDIEVDILEETGRHSYHYRATKGRLQQDGVLVKVKN